MYLEEYYNLKGNQFLIDKISKKSFFSFTSTNFNLTYIIKLKTKKSGIIFVFLLILLTFLNSFIFKIKHNFVINLVNIYEVFNFMNRLILVLLPFCIYNKNLFFVDYFNLNSINYHFNQFPLISEIENIIELNKFYIKIIREIESKIIVNIPFLNIFHKESLCHILKLPVYAK